MHCILSVIRQKLPQKCKSFLCTSAEKNKFLCQNNLKDLDPPYKTDLELRIVFENVPSYRQLKHK